MKCRMCNTPLLAGSLVCFDDACIARRRGASLLRNRVEYAAKRVEHVASRLAAILDDDARSVVELRDVAAELQSCQLLMRGES